MCVSLVLGRKDFCYFDSDLTIEICDVMGKYVITGGPCSGKTSLVDYLASQEYGIVPETAEVIIKEQLKSGGDMVPWNPLRRLEFQEELITRQIHTENSIPDGGTYFFDRAIPDNIAYQLFDGVRPSDHLVDLSRNQDYDCVFLLGQVPVYENSSFRKEDASVAKRLSSILGEVYHDLGYEVLDVCPMGSAKNRAELIMGIIKHNGI